MLIQIVHAVSILYLLGDLFGLQTQHLWVFAKKKYYNNNYSIIMKTESNSGPN